jgi:hypothetical protein
MLWRCRVSIVVMKTQQCVLGIFELYVTVNNIRIKILLHSSDEGIKHRHTQLVYVYCVLVVATYNCRTGDQHVHIFCKMFVKDVYSQTRHVSVHVGIIIRGGTENKTLVNLLKLSGNFTYDQV